MIRSIPYSLASLNEGKKAGLRNLLSEYRNFAQIIINDIWENGYKETLVLGKEDELKRIVEVDFDPKNDKLVVPLYFDYTRWSHLSSLSARMKATISDHVVDIYRGLVTKRAGRLYIYNLTNSEKVKEALDKNLISVPRCNNIRMQLSSRCMDMKELTHLDGNKRTGVWINLKFLGIDNDIAIPVVYHRGNDIQAKKYGNGTLKNGISVSDKEIVLSFEYEKAKSSGKKVIGIDTGIKAMISTSDGQEVDMDEFENCLKKITRKRPGSKARAKTLAEKKNIINRIINRLDLSNVKEVRVESVKHIGRGQKGSKVLKLWPHGQIRSAIAMRCELLGAKVVEQSSRYRSQRCSACGYVHKNNRKKLQFVCLKCGHSQNSDQNAANNHTANLKPIGFMGLVNRKEGFYWLPFGDDGAGHEEPLDATMGDVIS